MDHVLHSGVFEARNINALFFMVKWAWCGSHKKQTRTHYKEIVFLLMVQSTCHVVRSGVSEASNIDALFFMLGSAQCGSHKKRTRTRYTALAFLH
jgi:hypothetical protein